MNRKFAEHLTLTFMAGLVIGLLGLKVGPTHMTWLEGRGILDDALRGALVPLMAALAPFYPDYGIGAKLATVDTPVTGSVSGIAAALKPSPSPTPQPEFLKPQI